MSRVLLSLLVSGALSLAGTVQAAQPDLTGVWVITQRVDALRTLEGAPPPLNEAARAVYAQHRSAAARGDYAFDGLTRCLPPGLPRLMLMHEPFEILQKPKVIYFLHQLNRLPRRAYVDEQLPTDADPHYLGYSVAHWDGDALVVESSGFEEGTMLDNSGLPHSDALHLTERYELSKDGRQLHARFTIEDPKTFTQPWSAQVDYIKRPGYEIPEETCADKAPAKRPRN
jgi:hypothetical protein